MSIDDPTPSAATSVNRVTVAPWPTEQPLFALVLIISLMLWAAILLSIFGAIYGLFIGLALFFVHLLLIVHVRGSGVRLGPRQFPELDRRVRELALAAGITEIPAAYVMESGGALNAFATRFLRSRMIVLYSDLLDACGGDRAARDMVIGHELGHIKQGHLDWSILIAPGMFMPFLGASYSRARELTCDRWGAALCGDRAGALRGLAILAAGGQHGPKVDLESFAAQRQDLDTGWMTVGRWLSTYPTLAERVAALDAEISLRTAAAGKGPLRALGILAAGCFVPIVVGTLLVVFAGTKLKTIADAAARPTRDLAALGAQPPTDTSADEADSPPPVEAMGLEAAESQVQEDLRRLGKLLAGAGRTAGKYPADFDALVELWETELPEEEMPRDPFDGAGYGYTRTDDGGYRLWSSGRDRASETADDLVRVGTPPSS